MNFSRDRNMFGELEVFEEAKSLIHKLNETAISLFDIIEALILQAKLYIIEGNFQDALELFDQAKNLAEEKNLSSFVEKVSSEKQRFEEVYEKWLGLIQSNSSIQKRLEYSRLEQYIKEARKSMGLLKWSHPD